MKRTRLLKFLVIFCIILSFFGSVYAKSTSQFDVGDTNVKTVEESEDGLTTNITASAQYKRENNEYGAINFTSKSTGVFTIDVEGLTRYEGEDICYTITDSQGKEVRLAAIYDESESRFTTISNGNENSKTQIDVLLKAGETYTITLSTTKAKPGQTPKYGGGYTYYPTYTDATNVVADYNVSITVNADANESEQIYQSDISASEITDKTKTNEANLEDYESSQYEIPEDANTLFDGYDFGDAALDAGKAVLKGAKDYLLNPFEETICELLLAIGDFVVFIMNEIVGEEVTVTALVYNQIDAVNANFFDPSVTSNGISASIRTAVSDWYNIFKMIAIAIYIVVLLAIGVNVLLASTGNGMEKAKTLMVQWVKGILVLIFVPYIVKYAFLLNEAVVGMLRESANIADYKTGGSSFGSATEWSAEEVEFRSPEYVSRYTGSVAFGSEEASAGYLKKIETYEQNLDLMRIMRAYAGVTKKFIYAIIWFILIGQLIGFIVQYYKRYFMIAFLIAIFPIICIFHGISIARGEAKGEIGSWLKEILTNIFMQMVQAIIYTLITGICVSIVAEDIQSSATLNWLIIILAINYVSEGEKLLRKIIGAMGSTMGDSGQSGQGVKGAFNKAKANMQRLVTGVNPKEKKDDD